MKAADEVGFGVSEDLVGNNITGFTVAQTISKNGVRTTTVRSYITPFPNRRNLHVAINATVTKVDISGKKAKGVYVLMVRRRIEFERLSGSSSTSSLRLVLFAEWKESFHSGGTRGDPVSGSDQLAAAAHVVRNRAQGTPRVHENFRGDGSTGCR